MAFCTKCGTQFETGAAFCGNCGAAIAANAVPNMESGGSQQNELLARLSRRRAYSSLAGSAFFVFIGFIVIINREFWAQHLPFHLEAYMPEDVAVVAVTLFGIISVLVFGFAGILWIKRIHSANRVG
ncbi:MAG: zinc-ribbon domain-containing protein [Terracidiphilus sp.]|jgi:hypothetical protein